VARNDKHKVGRALDFAHQLRERRNDGGHTRPTTRSTTAPRLRSFSCRRRVTCPSSGGSQGHPRRPLREGCPRLSRRRQREGRDVEDAG
jgi:hypothetical protein